MKSYKSILLILLLGPILSVFAAPEPEAKTTTGYRKPAGYKAYRGYKNYRAPKMQRRASRSADGWGFGFSVNEYFGDYEYFGDLIPVYEMTKADWQRFGQGIAKNMGAGAHVSYFMRVNEVIDFRATASLNFFHGTHYEYGPQYSPGGRLGDNDMSLARFWALGLGIHDGVEIYPRRDASGFFFYAGGSVMFTIQRPTICDETFGAFGLLPMVDLGLGYKWSTPDGMDIRLDLLYQVGLLDYSATKAVSGGRWGFNSSIDGYPGRYVVTGSDPEAIYHTGFVDNKDPFHCWYQEIYDSKGNLVENRFRWPDSYLSLRLTFALPQMQSKQHYRAKSHR